MKTRKELRLTIRRKIGDGLDVNGAEDTANTAFPNATYNEHIDAALAEVASMCEQLRSLTGLEIKNFTWPADTETVNIATLGLDIYKVDSLWRMSDDWHLLDRIQELDQPSTLAWTGFDRVTTNAVEDWTVLRYSLINGSVLLIRPIPSTATKMQIRFPGSGNVRLFSDIEPLPAEFFFHPVIEEMVAHMVCRMLDNRPGGAERWQAEVNRGQAQHAHIFSPPRFHRLTLRGFGG